jgi:hypothetical protein
MAVKHGYDETGAAGAGIVQPSSAQCDEDYCHEIRAEFEDKTGNI